MTLSANLEGFSEHAIIINDNDLASFQDVTLLPSNVTVSFDADFAKNIEYQGQTLINFSAQSLVREDGQAIEGNVSAQVTIIDPRIDIDLMPGDMVTSINNSLASIESFGAINVLLLDESGANINLAQNQQATIRIPVASNSSSSPDTIPLYYFDEEQSIWIEEGQAEKVILDGESFYQGQVNHFTTWNADRIYETVNVNGCVVNSNNSAIPNVRIISIGRDYNGFVNVFTDDNGQFAVPVKTSSNVLIQGSQGGQTRTFTLSIGGEDFSIDDCLVLSRSTSTVKLTWGENPRDLDTHFYGPSDNTASGNLFHLSFIQPKITVENADIFLDVDDQTSFGREILTIPEFPFAGRYQYIINKFAGSGDIFESPTRVELNVKTQVTIFSPPQNNITDNWHVFDFVVDNDGNVIVEEINTWIEDLPFESIFFDTSSFNSKITLPNKLLINSVKGNNFK